MTRITLCNTKFVLFMKVGVLGRIFNGKNESVIRFCVSRTVFSENSKQIFTNI
ncbi:hypothetical protein C0J52_24518 [Blattella germanica]|nr:hypothetical protein C0J52_24518 [Blattella germanica]